MSALDSVDISLISLAGILQPQTRISGPRFFRVCWFGVVTCKAK